MPEFGTWASGLATETLAGTEFVPVIATTTTKQVTVNALGTFLYASATLTGTPTAPTASPGTNTTQIATTAFVNASFAPLASPALTGTPTAPTASSGTNTTQIATTAFVATSFAPLASPALTGTPTAPTASSGTNTTQIATTAFVHVSFAPLASPTFTGTPAAPTASSGTNTTQIATTAFVQAAVGSSTSLLWPTLTPPTDSQFSWVNQISGATSTQNPGAPLGVNLYSPAVNNTACIVGRTWSTQLSTPYHLQGYFLPSFLENNYAYGLYFTDGTKLVVMMAQQVNAPPVLNLSVYKFSSATGTAAQYGASSAVSFLPALWMRLGDSGTNFTFDTSPDGLNWYNIFTVSRTDYLSGSTFSVGWFIYPSWNVSGGTFAYAYPMSITCVHFAATA